MAVIPGTTNDDNLFDTSDSDQIDADTGNDTITVTDGYDSVEGRAGTDTLIVHYESATTAVTRSFYSEDSAGGFFGQYDVSGTRAVNFHSIENFRIYTGSGNDVIGTETGSDYVSSGAGDDFVNVGTGVDSADGGSGIDGITANLSWAGIFVRWNLQANTYVGPFGTGFTNFEYFGSLTTGGGNDIIVTTDIQKDESIFLNGGNDTVTVRNGRDSVNGGDGIDTLIIDYSGSTLAITTTGGEPTDQFGNGYLGSYGDGAQRSVGFQGINTFNITTGSGADVITLPNGGNRITYDIVSLGAGDDIVNLGQGLDVADGGAGIDSLGANQSAATDAIVINLMTNSYSGPVGTSFVNFEILGGGAIGGFQTGSGNDVIVTYNINRNDQVTTNGGDDTITFYDGADLATFGAGFDTLVVDYSAATNAVHNGQMPSDFSAIGTYFGDFKDDSTRVAAYQDVERFDIRTGSGNDQITTGNNNDRVVLGAGADFASTAGGNDYLDGGTGDDFLNGGAGNDVYEIDSLGDSITDSSGIDEVRTNLGSKAPPERAVYVLPDFIENLTGTSAGAQGVRDNALNNIISMGAGHDLVVADAGGVDTISGGGGNDFIYYGDKWTAADVTNGGAGTDTISLIGNYDGIVFTATNLIGVERMALYSSLYLPGTGPNNYNITMDDANVAAGTEFFVTAASLQSNESLVFNGSAEVGGRFTVHGGGGADTITGGSSSDFFLGNAGNDILNGLGGTDFLIGGLGADQLSGGSGADFFRYQSTAQSTTGSIDQILDFQHGDQIDLSAIDANGNAGDGNNAFSFIGSAAFGNVAGELRAYQNGADWFVEGDTNGDGTADLIIQVTVSDATPLVLGDFIL